MKKLKIKILNSEKFFLLCVGLVVGFMALSIYYGSRLLEVLLYNMNI